MTFQRSWREAAMVLLAAVVSRRDRGLALTVTARLSTLDGLRLVGLPGLAVTPIG